MVTKKQFTLAKVQNQNKKTSLLSGTSRLISRELSIASLIFDRIKKPAIKRVFLFHVSAYSAESSATGAST